MGCIALLHLQDSCAPPPRYSSLPEWERKVGAQSSAKPNPTLELRSCIGKPRGHITPPLLLWMSPSHPPTHPFFSFYALGLAVRGKVWKAPSLFRTTAQSGGIPVCGAARQCGVRLQPVRRAATGTERFPVGAQIAHEAPEGRGRGISAGRQKELYRGPGFQSRSRSEDISFSVHLHLSAFPRCSSQQDKARISDP